MSCLPAGVYEGWVASLIEGKSKSSGADMLTLSYTLIDPSTNKEWTVKDYITEAAMWKLKRVCSAIGDKAKQAFDTGDTEQVATAIKGENLKLTLEVEEGDYGDQNRIKKVEKLERGAAVVKDMSLIATSKQNTRQAASTGEPEITDSDIPFDVARR